MITATLEARNNRTYYNTEYRGVAYVASWNEVLDRWEVYSHRKALGRLHVGGVRFFKNAVELSQMIKAFKELPLKLQEIDDVAICSKV